MRRLLILTLPLVLSAAACDSGDGDDRNADVLALSGNAMTGEMVFTNAGCGIESCHGADGNSGMAAAPRLSDVVSKRSDDQLIDSVLDGRGNMPAQSLDDQEMADVLAWLRANF